MPYLQVTTSSTLNRKQKILIDEAVSKALNIVPEQKTEYLMSAFEDCASLILQGSSEPCAMVRIRVGQEIYERYSDKWAEMMKIITEIVSKVLDLNPSRIYVVCTGTNLWYYQNEDVMDTLFKQ